MIKHPIWHLRELLRNKMLDLLDPTPHIWHGRRNDRVKDLDTVSAVLDTWNLDMCSAAERQAVKELLESGLEARPLNAIERAHAVLEVVGHASRNADHDASRITLPEKSHGIRTEGGTIRWVKPETKRNTVWIDTRSGTWGTNTSELVIVDIDKTAETYGCSGLAADANDVLAFLEDAADDEIADYGRDHGVAAIEFADPLH